MVEEEKEDTDKLSILGGQHDYRDNVHAKFMIPNLFSICYLRACLKSSLAPSLVSVSGHLVIWLVDMVGLGRLGKKILPLTTKGRLQKHRALAPHLLIRCHYGREKTGGEEGKVTFPCGPQRLTYSSIDPRDLCFPRLLSHILFVLRIHATFCRPTLR